MGHIKNKSQMIYLNPAIEILTLNENCLKTAIKRQILSDSIKKYDYSILSTKNSC